MAINKNTKAFIHERDGYKCLRCGSTENITIDHVIPLGKGGSNLRTNMQTLCWQCNQDKGELIVDYRWIEWLTPRWFNINILEPNTLKEDSLDLVIAKKTTVTKKQPLKNDFLEKQKIIESLPRHIWEVMMFKDGQWVREKRYYKSEKKKTDFDLCDVPGLRMGARCLTLIPIEKYSTTKNTKIKNAQSPEHLKFLMRQTQEQFRLAKKHGWVVAMMLTEEQKNFHEN